MREDTREQVILKFQLPFNNLIDGSNVTERVNRHSDYASYIGENISYRAGGGEETVIRLVVDDGVPTRGHRDNVFNGDFNYLGLGVHDHPTWDNCVVLDYAQEIKPLGKSSSSKEKASYGKFTPKTEESKVYSDSDDINIKDVPK